MRGRAFGTTAAALQPCATAHQKRGRATQMAKFGTYLLGATVSAAALLACYRDRVIDRPVIVTPPPCLTRAAPLPPDGAVPCGARWADYYVELSIWTAEVERACGGAEP